MSNDVGCYSLDHGGPSYTTFLDCLLYHLPYSLPANGLGYFAIVIVVPAVIISIFGKFQDNYRLFIFNQAIWDIFVIYDSICDTPADDKDSQPKCFYSWNFDYTFWGSQLIYYFFKNLAINAQYGPLFLLALSRFMALYWPRKYKSLNALKTIVIFQVVTTLIINVYDWGVMINVKLDAQDRAVCQEMFCQNLTSCDLKNYYPCIQAIKGTHKWWLITLNLIRYFLGPTMLLAADIFAILVIIKILAHLKFQATHNRHYLILFIKISIFVIFECCMLSILCLITLHSIWVNNFSRFFIIPFPSWLGYLSRDYTIQWLSVFRIILDYILMYCLLTEYRRVIINFFVSSAQMLYRPRVTATALLKRVESFTSNSRFL